MSLDGPEVPAQLAMELLQSPCPFAHHARLKVLAPLPEIRATPNDLSTITAALSELAQGATASRPDALVIPALNGTTPDVVAALGELTYQICVTLCGADSDTSFALGRVLQACDFKWDPEWEGIRYFMPAFSNAYDRRHPRYIAVPGTSCILMQPEYSFRRFGVSGAQRNRYQLSERVHKLFAERGMNYDLDTVVAWPKPFRYVKPYSRRDGQQLGPVQWWVSTTNQTGQA